MRKALSTMEKASQAPHGRRGRGRCGHPCGESKKPAGKPLSPSACGKWNPLASARATSTGSRDCAANLAWPATGYPQLEFAVGDQSPASSDRPAAGDPHAIAILFHRSNPRHRLTVRSEDSHGLRQRFAGPNDSCFPPAAAPRGKACNAGSGWPRAPVLRGRRDVGLLIEDPRYSLDRYPGQIRHVVDARFGSIDAGPVPVTDLPVHGDSHDRGLHRSSRERRITGETRARNMLIRNMLVSNMLISNMFTRMPRTGRPVWRPPPARPC